jgi:hypothetical protein
MRHLTRLIFAIGSAALTALAGRAPASLQSQRPSQCLAADAWTAQTLPLIVSVINGPTAYYRELRDSPAHRPVETGEPGTGHSSR